MAPLGQGVHGIQHGVFVVLPMILTGTQVEQELFQQRIDVRLPVPFRGEFQDQRAQGPGRILGTQAPSSRSEGVIVVPPSASVQPGRYSRPYTWSPDQGDVVDTRH